MSLSKHRVETIMRRLEIISLLAYLNSELLMLPGKAETAYSVAYPSAFHRYSRLQIRFWLPSKLP